MHDSRVVDRWRTIIANWRSSGLSVAAFCRSQGVNMFGFHRWRVILDDLDHSTPIPPRSQTQSQSSTSFVPVRVFPDAQVEVILPSGLQLRVALSADARQFARLVLALAIPSC